MALNMTFPLARLLRQRSFRIAVRSLATASTAPAPAKPSFTSTLENGPSLDDFIAGSTPERVVLGNAKTCVPLVTMLTYPSLVAESCIPQSSTAVPSQDLNTKRRVLCKDPKGSSWAGVAYCL
jgi:hypothetical protein